LQEKGQRQKEKSSSLKSVVGWLFSHDAFRLLSRILVRGNIHLNGFNIFFISTNFRVIVDHSTGGILFSTLKTASAGRQPKKRNEPEQGKKSVFVHQIWKCQI
jgi:hypothetical protein